MIVLTGRLVRALLHLRIVLHLCYLARPSARLRPLTVVLVAMWALSACQDAERMKIADAGTWKDPSDRSGVRTFCELPGSVQYTAAGVVTVPGPEGAPSVSFLQVPTGFCAHYFARLGNARQLRFAPGGELFVASPTTSTTGGGPGGWQAVVILIDDNQNGYADEPITFLSGLPSTQGMLFAPGYFYYQDHTRILRRPYRPGERQPSEPAELMADINYYASALHWPKTLDQADDGTIYVGNGGDQGELCDPAGPMRGGIFKLDGSPGGAAVAKGLRNAIAVRCQRGHNLCFASELARDYSADIGGREKLLPIREGDDWGFPCCATHDLPFPDVSPSPDCSNVVPEAVSFVIGDTPFSFDFEPGNWAAPYTGSVFIPLHGVAGSWVGARIVAVAVDPMTGVLLPGTTIAGTATGAMSDFASGWDDGLRAHGRPAALAFSADGRLFVANDTNGDILWIAPIGLER